MQKDFIGECKKVSKKLIRSGMTISNGEVPTEHTQNNKNTKGQIHRRDTMEYLRYTIVSLIFTGPIYAPDS